MHEESVILLREALGWRLPPVRWPKVAEAVESMASAADPATVLGYLELAGHTRIVTRVEIDADGPASEPVEMPGELRERVNELIHRLESPHGDG
ncbi:CATRA system-associated protein [Spirillospora sp. NPDC029432]|uniref:CATRA system-associated protein n=1 Tax=Spirillospora sp. NPDC029432 TaxID=3154599 RepID=UPI003454E65B